jgi:hypothetical protein
MRSLWRVALVATLLASLGLSSMGIAAARAGIARLATATHAAAPRLSGAHAPTPQIMTRIRPGATRQQHAARARAARPASARAMRPARVLRPFTALPASALRRVAAGLIARARPAAALARQAARHSAGASAAACPSGFVDPVNGPEPFRLYLNAFYTSLGSEIVDHCAYNPTARTLDVALDGAYTMEADINADTGFSLPGGTSIAASSNGNISIDGNASIAGTVALCAGGIVVSAGGDLTVDNAILTHSTMPTCTKWGGIVFLPGSSGTVTGGHLSSTGSAVPGYSNPDQPGAAITADGASPRSPARRSATAPVSACWWSTAGIPR